MYMNKIFICSYSVLLLSGPSQQHGHDLQEFVDWCENSCFELNVSMTKEMIVTFSNKQRQMALAGTSVIHEKLIEIVVAYKYPGTMFGSLFKFTSNTEEIW